MRPEEVAWTLPYDLRYCLVLTLEVEHENSDILFDELRNYIKLEIFAHGHLSVGFNQTPIIQIKPIFLTFDVLTWLSQ